MTRSLRHSTPLACVMLDLDHFKEINDTHGHALGDLVLREVAGILRQHIRKSDIAVRYGGEEFVLLLFSNNAEGARVVAERIRRDIEGHVFTAGETTFRVTTSIGLCSFPDAGVVSSDDLMKRADAALYQAKEAGRNVVCLV